MSENEADLVAQLTKLGYRVTSPRAKTPPPRCSVCGAVEAYTGDYYDITGIPEDAFTADYLIQVVVQTNLGEEGYDKVVRFFCDEHDHRAIVELQQIGYVSHHHGSTCLLEDQSCSYDDCPHGVHSPYDLDDQGLYMENP